MNRKRLKILRAHLATLSDAEFDMLEWPSNPECGTACCIGGWADRIFGLSGESLKETNRTLDLTSEQSDRLFFPGSMITKRLPDAIAAIDSMLANPDDNALPVWPEKAVSA